MSPSQTEPADTINVHRKDGSSSQHTVRDLCNVHFDCAANRVITLDVD